MTDEELKAPRKALLKWVTAVLESALPPGAPARSGGERRPRHALAQHLTFGDVAGPMADVIAGPGGELNATKNGNLSFCSAESSALMAVNFLAPFSRRDDPLFGLTGGGLRMEREMPVDGVNASRVPTPDAVRMTESGSVVIEAKTAEPWRSAPKVKLSSQYDDRAALTSANTVATLEWLRAPGGQYRCLDAAQLLKHVLGVSSAIATGDVAAPARLVLLYWRPREAGDHALLLDLLEAEFDDFAGRLDDQPVALERLSTTALLDQWDAAPAAWLRQHAAALRARYDPAS